MGCCSKKLVVSINIAGDAHHFTESINLLRPFPFYAATNSMNVTGVVAVENGVQLLLL
jgi:hypothetical protein